jgi:hypothetical protein
MMVVVSAAEMFAMLAPVIAFVIAAELFVLRLALALAGDGSRSPHRQCRFSGSS